MEPLSEDALARLSKLGGASFLGKMIELFLDFGAGKLKEAHDAFEQDNFEAVGRAAHSLKSSAANVGALCVERLAANIEQQVRAANYATLADALVELEFEFRRVCPLLEAKKPNKALESDDRH